MKMKTIYVFGNEYLASDSFALRVSKHLPSVNIVKCRSPDDLLPELMDSDDENKENKDLIILDVVKNIKEPMIITDVSKIKVNSLISLHDFDVGYFLNLVNELGFRKSIKIIGIPDSGDEVVMAKKVGEWI